MRTTSLVAICVAVSTISPAANPPLLISKDRDGPLVRVTANLLPGNVRRFWTSTDLVLWEPKGLSFNGLGNLSIDSRASPSLYIRTGSADQVAEYGYEEAYSRSPSGRGFNAYSFTTSTFRISLMLPPNSNFGPAFVYEGEESFAIFKSPDGSSSIICKLVVNPESGSATTNSFGLRVSFNNGFVTGEFVERTASGAFASVLPLFRDPVGIQNNRVPRGNHEDCSDLELFACITEHVDALLEGETHPLNPWNYLKRASAFLEGLPASIKAKLTPQQAQGVSDFKSDAQKMDEQMEESREEYTEAQEGALGGQTRQMADTVSPELTETHRILDSGTAIYVDPLGTPNGSATIDLVTGKPVGGESTEAPTVLPLKFRKLEGDKQATECENTDLPKNLSVQLVDQNSKPIPNVGTIWESIQGDGLLLPYLITPTLSWLSNANGIASSRWQIGTRNFPDQKAQVRVVELKDGWLSDVPVEAPAVFDAKISPDLVLLLHRACVGKWKVDHYADGAYAYSYNFELYSNGSAPYVLGTEYLGAYSYNGTQYPIRWKLERSACGYKLKERGWWHPGYDNLEREYLTYPLTSFKVGGNLGNSYAHIYTYLE